MRLISYGQKHFQKSNLHFLCPEVDFCYSDIIINVISINLSDMSCFDKFKYFNAIFQFILFNSTFGGISDEKQSLFTFVIKKRQ